MNDSTARFILDLVLGRRQPAADLDWDAALEASLRYRLGGMAWSLGPWSDAAPVAVVDAWEEAHHRQALVATLLLEELDRVREALASAGVGCFPLKGMALVEGGLYEPGERGVDDLDVSVSEEDGPSAVEALRRGGWQPWSKDPEGTLAWSDAATFMPRGRAGDLGVSVDLHWRIDYGAVRYGRSGSGSRTAVGPGLSPEAHLVLTLEHFFKHLRYRTHVSALADAVRLSRVVTDWDQVVRGMAGSRWGPASSALLAGLLRSEGVPVPDGVVGLVPDRLDGLDSASLICRDRGRARRATGMVERWWWTGPRLLLRDVQEALLPPGPWLRARYPSAYTRRSALLSVHFVRVVRWAMGLAPSPLSPNQEWRTD